MSAEEISTSAHRLRELVKLVDVPEAVVSRVIGGFKESARLVLRSSANCEDLEDFAGAGLYESVINVAALGVAGAIRTVWSSLWTTRAVLSRRQAGIPHEQARMAVLLQELVAADYSFILHTANPVNRDLREVCAEIVVGLGEALASGAAQGSPYRLTCRKDSKAVNIQAFANFSQALRPEATGGLRADTLDYTCIEFSRVPESLVSFCRKLAAVGEIVEAAFQAPQDVEGAVDGTRIFLDQSRRGGLDCAGADTVQRFRFARLAKLPYGLPGRPGANAHLLLLAPVDPLSLARHSVRPEGGMAGT